jgi:uncharacterized protein YbjT (DUF2867 family)
VAVVTILVLGATGKTGRRVVDRLERRGVTVRAASRRSATHFDWGSPETWAPALTGVRAVYLVDSQASDAPETLSAFGAQAAAAGVERLVLLSSRDAGVSGGLTWLDGERVVREAGPEWTILRPTWFMQNFSEEPYLRDPVLAGTLTVSTGTGLEPFIDAEDIAEVAAAVLTEPGHAGQIYELSGPRLLTFADALAEIAKATGRELRHEQVSSTEFARHAAEQGLSPGLIEALVLLFGWIEEGRNAHLSDGVQRVLGREPRDFTEYAKTTAATGVWRNS